MKRCEKIFIFHDIPTDYYYDGYNNAIFDKYTPS